MVPTRCTRGTHQVIYGRTLSEKATYSGFEARAGYSDTAQLSVEISLKMLDGELTVFDLKCGIRPLVRVATEVVRAAVVRARVVMKVAG